MSNEEILKILLETSEEELTMLSEKASAIGADDLNELINGYLMLRR